MFSKKRNNNNSNSNMYSADDAEINRIPATDSFIYLRELDMKAYSEYTAGVVCLTVIFTC